MNNNPKIPKGWRQIRLGEILPENHMFYSFCLKKWVGDGENGSEKCAGIRQVRNSIICITKK